MSQGSQSGEYSREAEEGHLAGEEEQAEEDFETLIEQQLLTHPLGKDWGKLSNTETPQRVLYAGSFPSRENNSGYQMLHKDAEAARSVRESESRSRPPQYSEREIENSHHRYQSQESDLTELRPIRFGDINTMFQREMRARPGMMKQFDTASQDEHTAGFHSHKLTASLASEEPQDPRSKQGGSKRIALLVSPDPPLTFGDSARKRQTHQSTEGFLKSSRQDSVLKSVSAEAENDVATKLQAVPSMDECIELVQEALEEIYQEKMKEIEQSYLVQIEALNKEIQRLHAERVDSTIRPLSEQDYRLGDLEMQLKEKHEDLEVQLFEKYKRETEEAVRRVEEEMQQILEGRGLTKARREQLEFDYLEGLDLKYKRTSSKKKEFECLECQQGHRQTRNVSTGKKPDTENTADREAIRKEKAAVEQEKCEIARIKSLLAVNLKKAKETQRRLELKEAELDSKITKINSLTKYGTKLQRMRAEKVLKSVEDPNSHFDPDHNSKEVPDGDEVQIQDSRAHLSAENPGTQENPLESYEYGTNPQPSSKKVQQQQSSIQKQSNAQVTFSEHSPLIKQSQSQPTHEQNPLSAYIGHPHAGVQSGTVSGHLHRMAGDNFDSFIQAKMSALARARETREQARKREAELDFEIKKTSEGSAAFLIQDQNQRLTLSNLEVPSSKQPNPTQNWSSQVVRAKTDHTAVELNNYLEETMQGLKYSNLVSPKSMQFSNENPGRLGSNQPLSSNSMLSANVGRLLAQDTQASVSGKVKLYTPSATSYTSSKSGAADFLKPRPASLLTQLFLSNQSPRTAIHQQYQKVSEVLIQHSEEWSQLVHQHKDHQSLISLLEECMTSLSDSKTLLGEITTLVDERQKQKRIVTEIDYWQRFRDQHKEVLQKLRRREGIRSQIATLALEFSGINDIEEFIKVSGSCYTLLRAVDSGLKAFCNRGVQYKGIKIDLLLKLDVYEEDYLHKLHAQEIKDRYK